jgi:hypothetical protein
MPLTDSVDIHRVILLSPRLAPRLGYSVRPEPVEGCLWFDKLTTSGDSFNIDTLVVC